jgi:putative peptidoglycan lipid II flippase
MSRVSGDERTLHDALGKRLHYGLRQITFFVVPSAVAFIALGGELAGAVYQSGDFERSDTLLVWGTLAAYAIGIVASTQGRLYASAFYALRDTTTPVRYSFVRIGVSLTLGLATALWMPGLLGIDRVWGVVGLAAAAGIGGLVEFLLLRRAMRRRLGVHIQTPVAVLFAAAAVAAAAAWGVKWLIGTVHPLLSGILTLGTFGIVYLAMTAALGIPEMRLVTDRLKRLGGRKS